MTQKIKYRDRYLQVCFTPADAALLKRIAKRDKRSVSAWCREIILSVVRARVQAAS